MACVPVALRALRIFSSACVFSCVRCVFRCVKFLSLRILLRALRIRCVFFLSLRILLRRLRIRCVKFRSLRILLRALRILLRISLRNGLALRALRCVRRMEIGLNTCRHSSCVPLGGANDIWVKLVSRLVLMELDGSCRSAYI